MSQGKKFDLSILDALAKELGYRKSRKKIQQRTLTFLQYLATRYRR